MSSSQTKVPEKPSQGSSESLFEQVDWFVLEPRKKKWLVDGLLLSRGSSLLVGKPKAGKSTVAKNIAVAVLKGHSIFGRSVAHSGAPGRVIYLQMEGKDDVAGTTRQFLAQGETAEEAKGAKGFHGRERVDKQEEPD